MRQDESAAQAVREWLEDAWRHGEVVADNDGRLMRLAPRRATLSHRLTWQAQHVLRVVARAITPGGAKHQPA